jgi:hypothetical protein
MTDLNVRVTYLPGSTKVVVEGWNYYYGPNTPEAEAKELAVAEYLNECAAALRYVNR